MNDNKILFDYIKSHKWDKVKQYLKLNKEIDVNIRDKNNNYLITYAIMFNKLNITNVLIENGSRIDILDNNHKSILNIPIKFNYNDIFDLLISHNDKIIGESIIDIYDNDGNIPLHYAIKYENIHAIKNLLHNNSDVHKVNNNGYNALHLAMYSKSMEICKLILKYTIDINIKSKTGETPLHLACNFELYEIVKLLLDKGANPNVQDYDHDVTPLSYAVNINNLKIIKLLLKHKANPNLQDVFGSTPLHTSIIDDNWEIFKYLMTSEYTNGKINVNLYDINGDIPLHSAFNHDKNVSNYVDYLLDKSDLNHQDNSNMSCLHYIIKKGLWKKYTERLKKKKLNIFIKNKDGKTPYDFIQKDDKEEFMNMVIDSYLYLLKNKQQSWNKNWENICSEDPALKELTKEEKMILAKNLKNKNDNKNDNNRDNICRSIIKNKLDDHCNKCGELSYPTNEVNCFLSDIKDKNKKQVKFCTYVGITLDIIIGLIYLLKKYPSSCSTFSSNLTTNKRLCEYYESLGIVSNIKCEFMNFEIIWSYKKLFFNDEFDNNFNKCLKNNKIRFIIVPLGIELQKGNHANYILYDKKINEIERFEPHGSHAPYKFNYNPNMLDKLLERKFKRLNPNITYIRPSDYLPKIGFQLFDAYEKSCKKIGDPKGFCALWSMWYVDMRMKYKQVDRTKLVKNMIKTIKLEDISFKNMIRDYSKHVIKIRDNILEESKIDINDWVNDNYNNQQAMSVVNNIKKLLNI